MSNKTIQNANTENATVKSNNPSKEVHLGDGVRESATAKTNEEIQKLISVGIESLFDYLTTQVKDIPDAINHFLSDSKAKEEIADLWSERLYEQGVVPKGYSGLSDELLIHNFHQDGYMEGMYMGYLISVTTLAKIGVCKDSLLAARKEIIPKFMRKDYDSRKALFEELEGEIHKWAEEPNK